MQGKAKIVIGSVLLLFSNIIFNSYVWSVDKNIPKEGELELYLTTHSENWQKDDLDKLIDKTVKTILLRLKALGISEPEVIRQKQNIIVRVKVSKKDVNILKDVIIKKAHLEFRLVNNNPILLKSALNGKVPDGFELKYLHGEPILLDEKAPLTGDYIDTAKGIYDEVFHEPYVKLKFNEEGRQKFAELMNKNIGKRLAILIDDEVQSAPVIREPITSGEVAIAGKFSMEEASSLATALTIGELPLSVSIISENTKF